MDNSLYDLLRKTTVRIQAGSQYGTGFIVAPNTVLTCAHVVQQSSPVFTSVEPPSAKPTVHETLTIFWNNQSYPAHIDEFLPEVPDLALLEVPLPKTPIALLDHDNDCQPHDMLYGFGYPQTHPGGEAVTVEYEGPRQWGQAPDTEYLLKLKHGQVGAGMSGAPLLNERTWNVCGMLKRTRNATNDLGGFAIPSATIVQRIPRLKAQVVSEQWAQVRQQLLDSGKPLPVSPGPSIIAQEITAQTITVVHGDQKIETRTGLTGEDLKAVLEALTRQGRQGGS